jgi:circadian clock protein KaiC
VITDEGLTLVDVFVGPEGVLTGSARESQELINETGSELRGYALSRNDKAIDRKRKVLESKIAALNEEFDSVRDDLNRVYIEEDIKKDALERARKKLSQKRKDNGKNK